MTFDLPHDADVARPCRPTVSCTADLAAPGTLEIEGGAQYARLGGDGRVWTYPVLLKQTFTPWLELQAGSNGFTALRATPTASIDRHVDNVAFGPKLHVLDQTDGVPSLAITAQASVPIYAGGNDAAILTGHASKDAGPIHVDANAGVFAWWGASAAAGQPFGALAVSATPYAPIGCAVEAYAFGGAQPYASHDGGFRGVVTLTPRPWLVFDMGGDVGWFPSTRAATLFVGMTLVPFVVSR